MRDTYSGERFPCFFQSLLSEVRALVFQNDLYQFLLWNEARFEMFLELLMASCEFERDDIYLASYYDKIWYKWFWKTRTIPSESRN